MTQIRVDTYFRHVLHNDRTGLLFHWTVIAYNGMPLFLKKIVLFNMIAMFALRRVDAISYGYLYKFY